MQYDLIGRLIISTDPKGDTTLYNYDQRSRITEITDALKGKTKFAYDSNGNLLSVTDAKNQTITYTYSVRDKVASMIDQLNRTETYTYDLNDNLVSFTDRKSQATTYTYDAMNRIARADYADGSNATYTYNAVGRLTTITDSISGTISYTYSDTGCPSCGGVDRLIQEATPLGSINYSYDVIGRRTSMTVAGQPVVNYNYDAVSRLTQISQGAQVVNLGYDATGKRTNLTYPNGTNSSYFYDSASRLAQILHQGPSGIIENLVYTNDPSGNRISFSRTNQQAALPADIQAAYNAANQLTNWNNATPNLAYDNNGNLISKTDSAGTTTYTWDARNRLIAISGPGISANFVYDALGRRISKTINGVTTQYLYDGNDIIAEIQNSAVAATYLRSLNIDEPLVRLSTTAEYYHTDALGSTMALTDSTGAVQTTYSYEPFGRTYQSGQPSTNPFQYTGRENDNTGLYYYRARYYSPELQRFISEDPIGLAGGINKFVYVINSPVNFEDPFGLKSKRDRVTPPNPPYDPLDSIPTPAFQECMQVANAIYQRDYGNCVKAYSDCLSNCDLLYKWTCDKFLNAACNLYCGVNFSACLLSATLKWQANSLRCYLMYQKSIPGGDIGPPPKNPGDILQR